MLMNVFYLFHANAIANSTTFKYAVVLCKKETASSQFSFVIALWSLKLYRNVILFSVENNLNAIYVERINASIENKPDSKYNIHSAMETSNKTQPWLRLHLSEKNQCKMEQFYRNYFDLFWRLTNIHKQNDGCNGEANSHQIQIIFNWISYQSAYRYGTHKSNVAVQTLHLTIRNRNTFFMLAYVVHYNGKNPFEFTNNSIECAIVLIVRKAKNTPNWIVCPFE